MFHPDTVHSEKYLYNGKELQADSFDIDDDGISDFELDLYDYGARYYDPAIGRFTGVDPLTDEFPRWSPYNYTLDHPTNMIDPDGRAPNWIYDQQEDGSYKRREGVDNDGGENVHTYFNNNGTSLTHNMQAKTFVLYDPSTKQSVDLGQGGFHLISKFKQGAQHGRLPRGKQAEIIDAPIGTTKYYGNNPFSSRNAEGYLDFIESGKKIEV